MLYQFQQKDAAVMLSTLEKNLIGNYANFLRTEPEGKPTIKSNFGRGLSRLPGGQDHEEDLRQMRLHKFASSLMKQSDRMRQKHLEQQSKSQEKTSKQAYTKVSRPNVIFI